MDYQNGVPLNQFIRTAFTNAIEKEGNLSEIMECFHAFRNHAFDKLREKESKIHFLFLI